jgi:hypothetical protein
MKLGLQLLVIGSQIAMVLICLMVEPKQVAVFGRLNYPQFLIVLTIFGVFVSALAVLFFPSVKQRIVCFRVVLIWMGTLLPLLVWEVGSLLFPGDALKDNPWYVWAPGGTTESDLLIFERPPHLKWKGLSAGDIGDAKARSARYARQVTFRTDFEGFRNDRDITKAEIVFIGDSCTEAGNVPLDETFVAQVARSQNVVVRNLGRANHGPSAELVILKNYALRCHPRLIVWQICETNDLPDEVLFNKWIADGRPQTPISQQGRIERWKQRSPSYWLFDSLRTTETDDFFGTFLDSHNERHPMQFMYVPGEQQLPREHPGWRWLADSLRNGKKLLLENDIELIVLLIPMKMHVMGSYIDFSKDTRQFDTALPAHLTLATSLKHLCQELDVSFIDSTSALQQIAAEGHLAYFPYETHMSSHGHAVVADMLAELLQSRPYQP